MLKSYNSKRFRYHVKNTIRPAGNKITASCVIIDGLQEKGEEGKVRRR